VHGEQPESSKFGHSDENNDGNDQWITVTSRRRRVSKTTSLQQSAMKAVYIVQQAKTRRATSIVVSGLKPHESSCNNDLFQHLCSNAFHMQPVVTYLRQLARQTTGKIQPLLIRLNEAHQAQQLLDSVK
jgi:hypothetical protein